MTSKIILGAIVGIAFLAGTITTGTGVFAADHREAPLLGTAWHSILDKIEELRNEIQPEITQLRTDINTNATKIDRLDTEALLLREDINTNATKIDELEARIVALEGPIIP